METSGIQGGLRDSVQAGPSTPLLQSVSPLPDFKQLYLNDLRPGSYHRGGYVLLKAITQPIRMSTAVHFLLEDEVGDTVSVQLHHQGGDLQAAVEDLSVGSVCIIKEPWYNMTTDGSYGLRVDHVGDVVWLPKADRRVPLKWRPQARETAETAMQLKYSGNDALRMGNLGIAIEFYDAALQIATTPEEARTIKLNRSLANLRIGCFDKALEDAGEYTNNAMVTEKGLYRAARSLYELGRFHESHGVFESLLAAYPGCEAAKKELCRIEDRLREQDHGRFNFLAMHEAAAKQVPPCLDIATYGDPVTIKMTEGRGRGLFTTRDVAAGDLLLCEKAFSYTYCENTPTTNLWSASALKGTAADLVTSTVDQLLRTPSQITSVMSLHHGNYEPVKEKTVDGTPVVDRILIHRIISLNAFESSRAIILRKLDRVGVPKAERAKPDRLCSLHIKASYANHSCYSNSRRSFIGDVLILRATRDIPAGEEIRVWYTLPKSDHSYKKTQENLRNWDFRCSCEICTHDQETSNKKKKKRAALLRELDFASTDIVGEAGLAAIEKLHAAIEQTYTVPTASVPRLVLWDPYLALTRVYASIEEPVRTITTAWKVMAALGFVIKRDASSVFSSFHVEQWGLMVDALIETWVHLWMAYERLVPRRPELCKKAEEYARTTYKICIGEDETFEEQVGRVARKAIREGGDLGMASLTLSNSSSDVSR